MATTKKKQIRVPAAPMVHPEREWEVTLSDGTKTRLLAHTVAVYDGALCFETFVGYEKAGTKDQYPRYEAIQGYAPGVWKDYVDVGRLSQLLDELAIEVGAKT